MAGLSAVKVRPGDVVVADYGIVEDLFKAAPALTEVLKERLG